MERGGTFHGEAPRRCTASNKKLPKSMTVTAPTCTYLVYELLIVEVTVAGAEPFFLKGLRVWKLCTSFCQGVDRGVLLVRIVAMLAALLSQR